MRLYIVLLCICLLGGCASGQLNHNTGELSDSSGDLLTKQIAYNLSNYIKNPIAIPAQITIESGAASTSYSVTPTLSTPLSSMTAVANTFTSAVGAGSSSIGGTKTVTTAGASAGLSANNTWNQSYVFSVVTDGERFERLDALYRFAISNDPRDLSRYPDFHKTVTTSTPSCLTQQVPFVLPPEALKPGVTPPSVNHCLTSLTVGKLQGDVNGGVSTTTTQEARQITDDYYGPNGRGCIKCKVKGNWLSYKRSDGVELGIEPWRRARLDDHYLASEGGYDLYVRKGHEADYVAFAATVLVSLNGSTSSNAGGAAGGGGGSAGTSSPQPNKPAIQYFQQLF